MRSRDSDREDLRQDILLQLWKSYASFDGRSEPSTWMYRVALNTAISFRRKRRPGQQRLDDAPEHSANTQRPEQSAELHGLHRAIARLSPVEKAIIMQWLDERTYEQIADTMGMSVKNVSVRLVRIKSRLAQMFKEADQS